VRGRARAPVQRAQEGEGCDALVHTEGGSGSESESESENESGESGCVYRLVVALWRCVSGSQRQYSDRYSDRCGFK
jgi:hypothetical protein